MSFPGETAVRIGCIFSIFSGMVTLCIFGLSLFWNLEGGYSSMYAPANGLFAIMMLFGFLAVLSGYLGHTGRSKASIILSAISLPGSWFIGGLLIIGGFTRGYMANRALFQVQKEREKKFHKLIDEGKLDDALALARQSAQEYPKYAYFWEKMANPLEALSELTEE